MGLFSTTIQTLSEMALQESGVQIPQVAAPAIVDEFKASLDLMPSLQEEEMRIPAYAVPVRECARLHRYLIEMEDLSRYMITNGVSSISEAMTDIAEANQISFSTKNVALVVDEASILQEMDDLGMNIGGSNSNDGNIGDTGLLGKHVDIGKFRRFANSKEVVDAITNKYGIPIVKKNYNVGLQNVKHGDRHHDGNAAFAEDAGINPQPGDQVLNEKDPNQNQKPAQNQPAPSSSQNSNSSNNNNSVSESLQYLRDIASGRYDNQLMMEDMNTGAAVPNSTGTTVNINPTNSNNLPGAANNRKKVLQGNPNQQQSNPPANQSPTVNNPQPQPQGN